MLNKTDTNQKGRLLSDETSSMKQSSVKCGDPESSTSHGRCSQGCLEPSHPQLDLCLLVQGPEAHLSSLSPPPPVPKHYHQCSAGASWTVCFTVLPWSGVIEFLHNNKSFWLWSCFQIPAEGLIYFFLMIRWPVSNTVVSPMLACPLIFTHKLLTHFSSTPWQSWIILVAFSYKELIYQLALMADLS